MDRRRDAVLCQAFGLPYPCDVDCPGYAEFLALLDLGLCEAEIIADPRWRRSAKKAERDADLNRDTIHMAPTWRYADSDETGHVALVLPVGVDDSGRERPLSMTNSQDDAEFASWVVDLVAIPLDGKRPLSMTGHTLAVGGFEPDGTTLRVYGGALEWLRAHLASVRAIAADTPGHLVQQLHFPVPSPDRRATLLVEPMGLEWRVRSARCVIPATARQIAVPDSAALARLIDGRMRLPEKVRPMPVVRGPRAGAPV